MLPKFGLISNSAQHLVLNKEMMNKEQAKDQLIELLKNQVFDLVMMSKIELGDDVIAEINKLQSIIND